MTEPRFFRDTTPTMHQSNQQKNDYLADELTQLNSQFDISKIVRVDENTRHGWLIHFKS